MRWEKLDEQQERDDMVCQHKNHHLSPQSCIMWDDGMSIFSDKSVLAESSRSN
jgi:hypothetical protein